MTGVHLRLIRNDFNTFIKTDRSTKEHVTKTLNEYMKSITKTRMHRSKKNFNYTCDCDLNAQVNLRHQLATPRVQATVPEQFCNVYIFTFTHQNW